MASQISAVGKDGGSGNESEMIEKIARLVEWQLHSISDTVEEEKEQEDHRLHDLLHDHQHEENDEEVFRNQFGPNQSQAGLELNSLAEMIKSLETTSRDLRKVETKSFRKILSASKDDIKTPSAKRLAQLVKGVKKRKGIRKTKKQKEKLRVAGVSVDRQSIKDYISLEKKIRSLPVPHSS